MLESLHEPQHKDRRSWLRCSLSAAAIERQKPFKKYATTCSMLHAVHNIHSCMVNGCVYVVTKAFGNCEVPGELASLQRHPEVCEHKKWLWLPCQH
eukprot:5001286-Amphidinium_carterae.1